MKIALVSYEYPPDTAVGGIATYVEQAALMLAERGHQVEVFAASNDREGRIDQQGVTVHRVRNTSTLHFYRAIFPVFLERHKEIVFDVIESPDYKHDGYLIGKKIPDLAHVLRLHTATRMFEAWVPKYRGIWGHLLSNYYLLEAFAGACRRGMPWRDFEGFYDYMLDLWDADINDRHAAELADIVVSPCLDLLKFQMKTWNLDPAKVSLLIHPYTPDPAMLAIPCGCRAKNVGYFGQLSERKGLRVLGDALPLIFQRHPDATFLFTGRDRGTPEGISWQEHLCAKAGPHAGQLIFNGQIALREMHREYAKVDLCVFPSLWENFPNVCLEAMSAGRAIVGSWNGGMAEMLDTGECGAVVPPTSPEFLAGTISGLLDDPERCRVLGERARQRLLTVYSREKIAPVQEELYRKAVERRRLREPKPIG